VGFFRDTIIVADVRKPTLRFFGVADTVGRRLQVPRLAEDGARGVFGFTLLNDTAAFVSLSVAGAPGVEVRAPLFGLLDLRSGELEAIPFREPQVRLATAREADRFYHACPASNGQALIVENNGPAEYIGLRRDGSVAWATRGIVVSVHPKAATIEGSRSAAFQWNRLPIRPACSSVGIYSRVLPIQGNDPERPLGNIVVLDFEGRVRMNAPFTPQDTLLVQANWFADDSLLYIATTQAASPRVLAFRLRPRRDGETGVFLLPDSVRVSIDRDLIGSTAAGGK
jgi:hypothetical protein